MALYYYETSVEIRVGDKVRHHRSPAFIELVAEKGIGNDEDWYVKEFGGGVMVVDDVAGRTFIPADQLDEAEYLEFVSRG